MNKNQSNTKLTSKDLILLAIFSVLFNICMFLIAGVMGMIPVGFIFFGVVGSIPCGIIYMYMRAKIPKRGAIMTQAILAAIIYFFMGTPLSVAACILMGGVVAEIISFFGNYKGFWQNTLGYMIFATLLWVGFMLPMVVSKNYYIEYATKRGSSADYINAMLSFIDGPMFIVALVATAIGALFGALLGRKLLKKHFEKAGIV